MDFRKHFREGDRTLLNSGEFVEVFAVYPNYLECAVLNIKTEEVISENVKTITIKDLRCKAHSK